ncbi:MAG: class I SAM-dependent methyltransferase [Deltaproteobacteria bacterium]|nr:class I SAM-dependent methyltransferase [Deltaproteobacteria bacterium]
MKDISLSERVARERSHGKLFMDSGTSIWCWNTPAGRIRKKRRCDFLTQPFNGNSGVTSPKALEVGCGDGSFSGVLAAAFNDLTCLDVSDTLLDAARQLHPEVTFVNADIHQTAFPDASFDLIVGCSVLHHLDWNIALKEMFRILKPGGELRFSEPNMLNPQVFLQKNWPWLKKRLGDSPDETAFTPHQIATSLEKAGFTGIVSEPYEFLHPGISKNFIGLLIRVETLLEKTPARWIAGSIRIKATRK